MFRVGTQPSGSSGAAAAPGRASRDLPKSLPMAIICRPVCVWPDNTLSACGSVWARRLTSADFGMTA